MNPLKRVDPNRDHGKKMLFFIIFSLIFLTAVMTKCQNDRVLPAFVKEDDVATEATTEMTEELLPMEEYVDKINNFSIKVPEGFTKVIKDGFPLYVDAKTKSSIHIKTTTLDISRATMNSDAENTKITADGGDFIELRALSNTSNMLLYKKQNGSTIFDYVELNSWSMDRMITVECIIDDAYYKEIGPTMEKCLNSLEWTKEHPIPENCSIAANESAGICYVLPADWTYSTSGNALSGSDEVSGAMINVVSAQTTDDFHGLTQAQYASGIAGNRIGFVISRYEATKERIYGEAVFMQDGTKMGMIQAAIATGKYQTIITYEYPYDKIDEDTKEMMRESIKQLQKIPTVKKITAKN